MAGRSIFGSPFLGLAGNSYAIPPITVALNHDEVPAEELGAVLKRAVPRGYVGTSPQIVKFLDGEYLIYADGGVQFHEHGRSPGPLFYP